MLLQELSLDQHVLVQIVNSSYCYAIVSMQIVAIEPVVPHRTVRTTWQSGEVWPARCQTLNLRDLVWLADWQAGWLVTTRFPERRFPTGLSRRALNELIRQWLAKNWNCNFWCWVIILVAVPVLQPELSQRWVWVIMLKSGKDRPSSLVTQVLSRLTAPSTWNVALPLRFACVCGICNYWLSGQQKQ